MSIILKRGLESARASLTLAEGEIIFTKDNGRVYVGSGSSSHGFEIQFRNLTASYATVTNNLGVGTAAPSSKLQVDDNSGNGAIKISNLSATATLRTFMGVAGASSQIINGDVLGDFCLVSNGPKINISANNGTTDHFVILSNGNVGIGTTSPTSSLHVVTPTLVVGAWQGLRLRNPLDGTYDSGGSGAAIFFECDSPKGAIFYERKGPYGIGTLHILQNTASNASAATLSDAVVSVLNNGCVGIGTTSPYGTLDLGGAGGFKFLYYGNGGNTGYIAGTGINLTNLPNVMNNVIGGSTLASNGTATWAVTRGNGQYPYSSYTDLFTIDSRTGNSSFTTGNVGIGTTIPDKLLTVNGGARICNNISGVGTVWLSPDDYKYITNSPSTGDYLAIAQNPFALGIQIGFSTSGAPTTFDPKITILPSGNVRFNAYGAGTLVTDSSGNITASSDKRLKDVTGNFTRGLDALSKIAPALYRWNALSGMETKNEYAGLIAQDVQEAIPEAVFANKDGMLSLQDRPIIAALINAVKELKKENDTLKAQVEKLMY